MEKTTIDLDYVERIIDRSWHKSGDSKQLHELATTLEGIGFKDAIALVERLPANKATVVFRFLPKEQARRVFERLDAAHQADLVAAFHHDEVIDFFEEMDPDDRVALLEEVPPAFADTLLRTLDEDERNLTGLVLGYPKDSIGRVMSPEVIVLTDDMRVDAALQTIKEHAYDAETIYTLPIVNDGRRLVGVASFRDLFTAQPDRLLRDVMGKSVFARAEDDAEDVIRWFLPLDLLAMPIVDKDDRLVGILTVDDAQDIAEHEDSEDAARGGGHEPLRQPYLATPLRKIIRARVVWLTILALSAVLTVHVLDYFEATLSQAVVLALFIPLLTGTGGNTGNQAATTVTRSLALGDVQKRDVFKVLWREMRVGFGLGVLLGSGGFVIASIFFDVKIGMVIAFTLVAVCTMAASVGGVMPIVAKTIGADPAVFSNPFISTFSDATGLIIYFLIAKAILGI